MRPHRDFYEKPYLYLIIKDTAALRKYVETLLQVSPAWLDCIFHADVTMEEVKAALEGVPYETIREVPETMYFGEPFVLPAESGKSCIPCGSFRTETTPIKSV